MSDVETAPMRLLIGRRSMLENHVSRRLPLNLEVFHCNSEDELPDWFLMVIRDQAMSWFWMNGRSPELTPVRRVGADEFEFPYWQETISVTLTELVEGYNNTAHYPRMEFILVRNTAAKITPVFWQWLQRLLRAVYCSEIPVVIRGKNSDFAPDNAY